MVGQFFAAMTRPIRGLHEAAYVLAGFSVLSQLLALVRDRTFAHLFGAGPTLDSYFAAFRIPDLIFALLTLFVSSYALVPLLSSREEKEQGALLGNVLFAFGGVALVASVALWFLMPFIVPFLFPGFAPDMSAQTVMLSRIMLLQPVLLGLSSIATSLIQVLRRFVVFALAPILYNFGIILGAVVFYPIFGVQGLAWGVVLGAVFHLLIQGVSVLSHAKHITWPSVSSLRESVIEVAMPSMPRALALSSQQVLLLAFASIASLTAVGTVSALSFATNLQSVPLTVIGISYAAALFPALATLFAAKDTEGFVREVWASIRHIVFWTMPASIFIVVFRAHIVRLILGSGKFSWEDTRLTAAILALFALSLIAQSAILIFSRAYYAAHKTVIPIIVNVGSTLLAAAAAYFGVVWLSTAEVPRLFIESLLRVEDVPGTAVLMIPLAYSAVMIVAAGIFGILFSRRFGASQGAWNTLLSSFAASVFGGGASYAVLAVLAPYLSLDTVIGLLSQAAVAGVAGLAVWAVSLYLLKSREFTEVVSVVLKRASGIPAAPHAE